MGESFVNEDRYKGNIHYPYLNYPFCCMFLGILQSHKQKVVHGRLRRPCSKAPAQKQ